MRKKSRIHKLVPYQGIPVTGGDVLKCDLALIPSSVVSKVRVYLDKLFGKNTYSCMQLQTDKRTLSPFYFLFLALPSEALFFHPAGVREKFVKSFC